MSALVSSIISTKPTLAGPIPCVATPRVFNHDIMGCTADGVTGNHLYSGRALGATEPGDMIQLHPDLKAQWPFIRGHYERVGLSFTDRVVWHVEHSALTDHPEREISVFYFGPAEHEVRPDRSWYRIVHYINSKNNFMDMAAKLGVPVPPTDCFDDVAAVGQARIAGLRFPCYLKAAISVSGVGIYRCPDEAELRRALTRFEPGVPVQIQAEVVADAFLNLQYQVDAQGLSRLAATEQILDGPVHQGNRYPACDEPWDCVEPMAEALFKQGIKGVYAFDVAVTETPGGNDYLAIECNPRFNGASYPTAVARKLGIERWLARAVRTRHRSLADVDLSGLEYDQATGEGVILVNWGPILVGKLLVLLAGSEAVQKRLSVELEHKL